MLAAVVDAPGRVSVRELPDPAPGPGQLLVRVEYASICGSDHHAYLGEFGPRVTFPAVLGHEFSGTVEALGPGASGPALGSRVAVDPVLHCGRCRACREGQLSACRQLRLVGIDLPGGFGGLVAVPEAAVFPLPASLPPRLGPLVELTSVACHAVSRARYAPGQSVAIFGAGKLGLALTALLGHCSPAALVAVDIDDRRLALARELGATAAVNARNADPVRTVLEMTDGTGVDLAFEAVGSWVELPGRRPPVTDACRSIRNGGRVLVLGQGRAEQPVAWKELVWKEAEIVTSRVSRGEFPRAIALVASGRMPVDRLVTHELAISEAPEAFAMMDAGRGGAVKILLRHGRAA